MEHFTEVMTKPIMMHGTVSINVMVSLLSYRGRSEKN